MRAFLLAVPLLASFAAASDVPFYLRGLESERDVAGINENFRSVVNDITKMRADLDSISSTTASGSSSSTGGIVLISSVTVDLDALSWTNTVIGPSISGTTLTLIGEGGGYFHLWIRASLSIDTSQRVYVAALRNSVVTPLQTGSTALSAYYPSVSAANQDMPLAVDSWFPSSSGISSFTLTGFVGSNTGVFIGCKSRTSCYWGVEEWKAR